MTAREPSTKPAPTTAVTAAIDAVVEAITATYAEHANRPIGVLLAHAHNDLIRALNLLYRAD